MRKGTILLISFLLGLVLVGGYIIFDSHQNTQASTTYYTVTLNTEDKEKGTVKALEEKEYKSGEKIVLRATPTEEYVFSGWYISNELISTQNPYTYEVKNNVTIIAKFKLEEVTETPETYTVTLTASEGGTVTELEQTEYEANSEITLQATANEGYTFLGFYDDTTLISSENPYTYTVNKNVNITAKFEVIEVTPETYTVTLTASEGGTVTELEQTEYEVNSEITLQATANEGYNFLGFYEDATLISSENPHTYTVTKNVEITANFEKNPIVNVLPYILQEEGVLGLYTGNDTEVVVPATYSLQTLNATYEIFDPTMFDYMYSPVEGETYNFYDLEENFLFSAIYNGYAPIELMEYYDQFQYPDYPTIKVNGLFNNVLVEGNDYQVIRLESTFLDNSTIESVTISEGILEVGTWAFENCPNLVNINIPESLQSFSSIVDCPLITELNIKNADMSGSSDPFTGVGDIYITANETNEFHKTINGSLYSKDGTILYRAYCVEGNFIIPEACIKLGRCAFYGTSINSLIIPSKVTETGVANKGSFNVYFMECTQLQYLEIQGNFDSCSAVYFKNCTSLETIKRPSGTMTNLTTTELQKYNCNAQIVDL